MNNLIVGAYVGDSGAYLLGREMGCDILTADPSKAHLGSGEVAALPIRAALKPKDTALLLSDVHTPPLVAILQGRSLLAPLSDISPMSPRAFSMRPDEAGAPTI